MNSLEFPNKFLVIRKKNREHIPQKIHFFLFYYKKSSKKSEKFPEPPLLPGSAEDRAQIRSLALQIVANTQPLQNLGVLEYVSDEPAKKTVGFFFVKIEKFKLNC